MLFESPGGVGINTEPGSANAGVYDMGGKSFAVVALFLAIVALLAIAYLAGSLHKQNELQPQLVSAQVEVGKARAEATANEARTSARIALDDVMRVKAQLEAKGLYRPTDGH